MFNSSRLEGFQDVVVGSERTRFDNIFFLALTGHNDNGNVRADRSIAHGFEDIESTDFFHVDVAKNDVDVVFRQLQQGVPTVETLNHFAYAHIVQYSLDSLTNGMVVVHDQGRDILESWVVHHSSNLPLLGDRRQFGVGKRRSFWIYDIGVLGESLSAGQFSESLPRAAATRSPGAPCAARSQ